MAATHKNNKLKDAGQLIELFGNPSIKIESAENEIMFPGGHICVSRCSDGKYWAHIYVNREPHNADSLQGATELVCPCFLTKFFRENYKNTKIRVCKGINEVITLHQQSPNK